MRNIIAMTSQTVPERLFMIIYSCHHFADPALELIFTVRL